MAKKHKWGRRRDRVRVPLTAPDVPLTSWWVTAPREGFTQHAERVFVRRFNARMLHGTSAA